MVGFALEAGDAAAAITRGKEKLRRKHLDLIAVNRLAAVDAEDNEIVLLYDDGRQEQLPSMNKQKVAAHLVAAAMGLWNDNAGRNNAGGGSS